MDKQARTRRPVVAAVFLGATLAALSPSRAEARPAPEAQLGVVHDLGRYCTTCWRNARVPADLWADCTQDVFHRLLERVPTSSWEYVLADQTEERREFLRAIDTVKKRVRRARKPSGAVDAVADPRNVPEQRRAEDREAVHRASADVLSSRQQRILQRSFEGWSVNEIAEDLALPSARISDEKYKAIQKLRCALQIADCRL